jgi:hypothetical protein
MERRTPDENMDYLRQENWKEIAALQRIGYIYIEYIEHKKQTKL